MTIEVDQAIAELQELVKCRCDPAYTDRGLHDPDCQCDYASEVKVIVDYIEQLISTRNYLAASADKAVALMYKEKDKLAKAIGVAQNLMVLGDDDTPQTLTGYARGAYFASKYILKEITGDTDD
jgi:hypothetical protein